MADQNPLKAFSFLFPNGKKMKNPMPQPRGPRPVGPVPSAPQPPMNMPQLPDGGSADLATLLSKFRRG